MKPVPYTSIRRPKAHNLLQVLPGRLQPLDDGLAHVCRGENSCGGAEGEDLLQDLVAVEVVVVELHGVGVGVLIIAGFFIIGSKHHETALNGVVLAFNAQSHALATAREEALKGFFGACRDARVKALDRLEARDAHLDGAHLVCLPDDEVEAGGRGGVFEATRPARW